MSGAKDPMADSNRGQPTGSSSTGEPEFLVVGRLHRPHGVRGEIVMEVVTDFPERLKPGMLVFVGEDHQPQQVASLRPHDLALIVSFSGFNTPEDIGRLRNHTVYVRTADRPALAEGEYYHHQILGLKVIEEDGNALGFLTDILETGANDVYIVQPEGGGREILLPAISDVVREIDLEQGTMTVRLLPGLLA